MAKLVKHLQNKSQFNFQVTLDFNNVKLVRKYLCQGTVSDWSKWKVYVSTLNFGNGSKNGYNFLLDRILNLSKIIPRTSVT